MKKLLKHTVAEMGRFNMSIEITYPIRAISKDNEKIRSKAGRYFVSKKYKDFESFVRSYSIAQKNVKILKGKIKLKIFFYFKDKRHGDLQNLSKSICDALTGVLYYDDKQICEIQLVLYENCPRDYFVINVEEKINDATN